jgi:hypothetical protein
MLDHWLKKIDLFVYDCEFGSRFVSEFFLQRIEGRA